jgi:hypothetical protein
MKNLMSYLSMCGFCLMLALAACSSSEEVTGIDEQLNEEDLEVSLDKEFGGYDSDDEAAAFGDIDIMESFPEDAEVVDSYDADPEVADAVRATPSAVNAYFLRITWGLLEGDSTATDVIDWSGSAEISKGTLVVMRKIRFEQNDQVLRRDSRQKVEFTSLTKPHFDGLMLAIIDNDDSIDTEGRFTLKAGEYEKSFAFSELDSLEMVEPVGSGGHEVSIVTRNKNLQPFAGGFLEGRWVKSHRNGGELKGRWINSTGDGAGHIKGIWGINRFGNKVFKAKYIDINGQFRGLINGQWGYERGTNGGYFKGRFFNSERRVIGTISGKFKHGRQGTRRGYFQARYEVTNGGNKEGN